MTATKLQFESNTNPRFNHIIQEAADALEKLWVKSKAKPDSFKGHFKSSRSVYRQFDKVLGKDNLKKLFLTLAEKINKEARQKAGGYSAHVDDAWWLALKNFCAKCGIPFSVPVSAFQDFRLVGWGLKSYRKPAKKHHKPVTMESKPEVPKTRVHPVPDNDYARRIHKHMFLKTAKSMGVNLSEEDLNELLGK